MHPIIWTLIIISSLGLLYGLGVLIHALINSFKKTLNSIIFSKEIWLTALTILSYILAVSYKNFFYGFPAVPLLIASSTVIMISRRLMLASVIKKSKWLSILIALIWGIWSFCIYSILQTRILPDYPTLHQLREHGLFAYGVMMVLIMIVIAILSTIINIKTALQNTRIKRQED